MQEDWIVEPIGPGLWRFAPKDPDQGLGSVKGGPSWYHRPMDIAWANSASSGLSAVGRSALFHKK